jgi:hypothetical protein
MMDELDLRREFSLLSEEAVRRTRSCPDAAQLATYVEGRLGEPECERLEDHLADCGFCLGQVRFLVRSAESGPAPAVPARLIESVREPRRWLGIARPAVGHRGPAWAMLAAAAGLVLVVVTVRFGRIAVPAGTSPSTGAPETESVDTRPTDRAVRNHAAGQSVPTVVQPKPGQRVGRETLTLIWEPVAEALDYSVQLMDGRGNPLWEDRTEALSTTIPSQVELTPGHQYFVWVAAHLRSGLRVKSSAVEFTIELE